MVEPVYDRVTEVISPFSGVEFVPEDILRPAAERGTLVHKYVEGLLQGFKGSLTEEMIPYVESFEKFWDSSKHVFDSGKIILEFLTAFAFLILLQKSSDNNLSFFHAKSIYLLCIHEGYVSLNAEIKWSVEYYYGVHTKTWVTIGIGQSNSISVNYQLKES